MSAQQSNLYVDIGNTRVKYAFECARQELDVSSTESVQSLVALIEESQVSDIWLSSVGHKNDVAILDSYCHDHGITLHIAATRSQQLGIQCAYKTPENLGVDRWLAVLAARELTSLPCAVIDLGTAMTCDVIVGEQHLGGWIAPGYGLMQQSLFKNTQQVFGNSSKPDELNVGEDTPECVNYGCMASVMGFVAMAEQYLKAAHDDYRIILTGGDQSLVQHVMINHALFVDNLVISGLRRLAQST